MDEKKGFEAEIAKPVEEIAPVPMSGPGAARAEEMDAPQGLDAVAEDGILSVDEIKEIERAAEVKAAAEEKTKAKREAEEQALRRARGRHGKVPALPATAYEMVKITVNVPPGAAIGGTRTGIVLDGRTYEYGRTYTVQRMVADTLRDKMAHAYKHEREIKGEKVFGDPRHRETVIHGRSGVVNRAPQFGSGF
ncbi:MAG: hypothetical protein AABZ67_00625 [Pseudomonadota bacterium]